MRLSKEAWAGLDENDKTHLAKQILTHYRREGFPHYNLNTDEKQKEYNKLVTYLNKNIDTIISDGNIKQTMHGLALAWSYMPHSWGVKIGNMKTPLEVFENDDLLLKAILRRMTRGDYFSDSGMRKALRTYSGTQSVSNFRPTAAAAIYHKYAGENATVWDMSCGYGGRLLGAIAAPNIYYYIGTDPATQTMQGLQQIAKDFAPQNGTIVDLLQQGSEEPLPIGDETVDLCFTSPPYFDTEKYSNEETQSYKKFDTTEKWNEGFLRKTIQNCYRVLKTNKHMIINVANVKSHPNLVADTIKIAEQEGFKHEETLNLLLSSITKGGYKSEPTLVFKKENKTW